MNIRMFCITTITMEHCKHVNVNTNTPTYDRPLIRPSLAERLCPVSNNIKPTHWVTQARLTHVDISIVGCKISIARFIGKCITLTSSNMNRVNSAVSAILKSCKMGTNSITDDISCSAIYGAKIFINTADTPSGQL